MVFQRKTSNQTKESSQYSFTDQTGKIILWGFGMVCATNNDGIFLGRHVFGQKDFYANITKANLLA